MDSMIRVEKLTKYYGKRLAVDKISFNVEKGEIVGLLGPNAAGKNHHDAHAHRFSVSDPWRRMGCRV